MFLLEAHHVLFFKLLLQANVMLEHLAFISLLLRCKSCNHSVYVGGTRLGTS